MPADPDEIAPKAEPTRGYHSGRGVVPRGASSTSANNHEGVPTPSDTETKQAQQRSRELRRGLVITDVIRAADASAARAGGVFLTADDFMGLLNKIERLEGGVQA